MTILTQERCVACRKDSPRVTDSELTQLKPQIPEWTIVEHNGVPSLERAYRLKNFVQALAFTNKVGALAEEEGHHPAILTEYGKVTVVWWTHKIKGLHRNDFIMAAKTAVSSTSMARPTVCASAAPLREQRLNGVLGRTAKFGFQMLYSTIRYVIRIPVGPPAPLRFHVILQHTVFALPRCCHRTGRWPCFNLPCVE